jgi:hypothetical protein
MSFETFQRSVIKTTVAELNKEIREVSEEVLGQCCDLIVAYAKFFCPVKTGSLQGSIRKERGGVGKGWAEYRVRAGGYIVNPETNRLVDYAAFVEARTPFLMPAVELIKPEISTMIASRLAVEVK